MSLSRASLRDPRWEGIARDATFREAPMRLKALIVPAAIALVLGSPARADVTLKGTGSGSGMGMSAEGSTVTYLKGDKMRSDWTREGRTVSSILDLDAQKMIVLDHAKKKAETYDLAEIASRLKVIPDAEMKVEVKATGKSREILGHSCQEYLIRIVAPYKAASGESVDTIFSGPAWVSKDSPGVADYRAFYLKAAQKGLFFSHPAAAKADPGRAKGMILLMKELAKAGIPYQSDIAVQLSGTGLMAQMMSKMGSMKMTGTLRQISTSPLSSDLFAIPAGYKAKNN